MGAYLDDYTAVGVMLLAATALAFAMVAVNWLFRPFAPSDSKAATYESGAEPEGEGWAQSNVRFFVYAYLYVVFAVDAIFLFPWALVLQSIGAAAAVEMAVFVAVLGVGLAYAWRKGVLSWTR